MVFARFSLQIMRQSAEAPTANGFDSAIAAGVRMFGQPQLLISEFRFLCEVGVLAWLAEDP